MRNRVAKLACLLLLLTSIGAADASTRRGEFSLGGHYIGLLMMQSAAAAHVDSPLSLRLDSDEAMAPPVSTAIVRFAWTMRPPSAQSVHMHAVTSSGV